MKIRTITALIILCLIIFVSVFSLKYLENKCGCFVDLIKAGEYEDFFEEFEKSKTMLSLILDGKKVALAEETIEKIQMSHDNEERWLILLVEIEDWYVAEEPSVINIF